MLKGLVAGVRTCRTGRAGESGHTRGGLSMSAHEKSPSASCGMGLVVCCRLRLMSYQALGSGAVWAGSAGGSGASSTAGGGAWLLLPGAGL